MGGFTKGVLIATGLLLLCSAGTVAAQDKACAQDKSAAPDTVVLTGAAFGSVTFAHITHEKMTLCVNCHHASKPEKPLASEHQKCGDCHTTTAAFPMTTTIRDAFHDLKAKSGTCMDCHVHRAATMKGVPLTCRGCHVKKI